MTPREHRAAAEGAIATLGNPRLVVSHEVLAVALLAPAHQLLGLANGEGSTYRDAEETIAKTEQLTRISDAAAVIRSAHAAILKAHNATR